MKNVLLLSDTHSFMDELILQHVAEADEIWHAGDVGDASVLEKLEQKMASNAVLRVVKGNIDGGPLNYLPNHLFFHLHGLSFLMTHIPGPLGRYTSKTRRLLLQYQPQVFLCGHSHILKVQRDDQFGGMLYINPGAAGIHGFHKQRTMIRMKIREGKLENMAVIDMGRRGKIF